MSAKSSRPRGLCACGGSGRNRGVAGRKKRAKTDRADARLLRTLLSEGWFPGVVDPDSTRGGDADPGPAVLHADG
jgi:hypothetical protein